ncbi:MAG: hypothetical protein ACYDB4_17790 [Candidatus Dormibacteraceae bacterium]
MIARGDRPTTEAGKLASAFWPEGTAMLSAAYRELAIELEARRQLLTIGRCCDDTLRLIRSAYELRGAAGMTAALACFAAHVLAHDPSRKEGPRFRSHRSVGPADLRDLSARSLGSAT